MSDNKLTNKRRAEFRERLLAWYDVSRRDLPWRAKAGRVADPYHVWLSEIMLQQTNVTAAAPYYIKFLMKWPDVRALAAAAQDDIMKEWAGLGYYARARNLHACAKMVVRDLNGIFPKDQKALQNLPGIGEYTSAAIRAIAFNKPATVVDGNIERITARYFAVEDPLPGAKPFLKKLAGEFFENYEDRPGDLAQAMMDLGSGVCIPGKPRCMLCPVQADCAARNKGLQDVLPRRSIKKVRPEKIGHVYWIADRHNRVLLEKRGDRGLLGGMMAFPTSNWTGRREPHEIRPPHEFAAQGLDLAQKPVSVHHVFTHFSLELVLKYIESEENFTPPDNYMWVAVPDLGKIGFPSLFKKAYKIFITHRQADQDIIAS